MTNLALDYPRPVGVNQLPPGVGVLRYWPKQGGSRVVVGLTRAEITALQNDKRPFTTIYEAPAATWMAGGYGAGQQAGRWLQQQFEDSGYTPRAVYLAADDPGLSTAAVNACLDGAASVLGHGIVGLYGFLPQLKAAYAGGHASWWWLTGRYVNPADYPWIHVYQCQGSQPKDVPTKLTVGGQETDVNMILRPDWGQDGEVVDMLTPDDGNTEWAAESPYEGEPAETHPVAEWVALSAYRLAKLEPRINAMADQIAAMGGQLERVTGMLAALTGGGVTLGASGQITVGPVPAAGTGDGS